MDISGLPRHWRAKAANQPRISSNDVDIRLTLKGCADDLELAWHQHAHDGEFESGCRFCDWERVNADHYPEGGL